MKRIAVYILVGLMLSLVVAGAVTLTDKVNKKAEFDQKKALKEVQIASEISNLKYISDKECVFDYVTEQPVCSVCFELTYNGQVISQCIYVPEKADIQEVQNRVNAQAKEEVRIRSPTEEVKYTDIVLIGGKTK